MSHQGDPEGLPVSPAVVRPPTPEGLVGVPLRILVAEDNEFNRRHLERLLVRQGYSGRLVNNGLEALDLLGVGGQGAGVGGQGSEALEETWSSPPTPDPHPLIAAFDLLLLDLHMPELDGFQVVRAIRERERAVGGHLPVIALTARSRQEDRERCLAAGMDDYLSKPVRTEELFAAIDRGVLGPRCFPAGPAGCWGPHESARPGCLAGCLR
jgi:CheY-like chemotaxis protein